MVTRRSPPRATPKHARAKRSRSRHRAALGRYRLDPRHDSGPRLRSSEGHLRRCPSCSPVLRVPLPISTSAARDYDFTARMADDLSASRGDESRNECETRFSTRERRRRRHTATG